MKRTLSVVVLAFITLGVLLWLWAPWKDTAIATTGQAGLVHAAEWRSGTLALSGQLQSSAGLSFTHDGKEVTATADASGRYQVNITSVPRLPIELQAQVGEHKYDLLAMRGRKGLVVLERTLAIGTWRPTAGYAAGTVPAVAVVTRVAEHYEITIFVPPQKSGLVPIVMVYADNNLQLQVTADGFIHTSIPASSNRVRVDVWGADQVPQARAGLSLPPARADSYADVGGAEIWLFADGARQKEGLDRAVPGQFIPLAPEMEFKNLPASAATQAGTVARPVYIRPLL
jgi:hypothetical protein